jgi:hypothetical protein
VSLEMRNTFTDIITITAQEKLEIAMSGHVPFHIIGLIAFKIAQGTIETFLREMGHQMLSEHSIVARRERTLFAD